CSSVLRVELAHPATLLRLGPALAHRLAHLERHDFRQPGGVASEQCRGLTEHRAALFHRGQLPPPRRHHGSPRQSSLVCRAVALPLRHQPPGGRIYHREAHGTAASAALGAKSPALTQASESGSRYLTTTDLIWSAVNPATLRSICSLSAKLRPRCNCPIRELAMAASVERASFCDSSQPSLALSISSAVKPSRAAVSNTSRKPVITFSLFSGA